MTRHGALESTRGSSAAAKIAAPGGGAAPIDRSHLARYTLGDERLEREILNLFVAQLPLTIESLSFAVTDRDWQCAAHTLKGSGRAVGATRIAELGLAAEKIAGATDLAARKAILAEIGEAVSEVEAYLAEAFPAAAA